MAAEEFKTQNRGRFRDMIGVLKDSALAHWIPKREIDVHRKDEKGTIVASA